MQDGVVEIVAAEVGISIGGEHFEDAIADFQDRDIECSAAEVEYSDFFVVLLIETIGERGSSRLRDDPFDIESGDASCIFCRLTLRVVEVSGDCDHGFCDFFSEIGFCSLFHFDQDLRSRLLLG